MKNNFLNIKKILLLSIFLLLTIVLFIDNEELNSFVVKYEDNFMISEVNTFKENTANDVTLVKESINSSASTPELLNNVASGNWLWPTNTNYVITSYFGYRWGGMHDAIDISGPGYGSNIYAANNGIVSSVKGGCIAGHTHCNGRGGNYIIINHNSNNYYTIYMHLKDIYVSEGQIVSRGQVIGTMGNTGNVVPVPTASNPYNGTHLHFGLYIGEPYRGGYAVNPMRLY